MNNSQAQALRYIANTNGGATRSNFVEDYEPVGEMLWREIKHLVSTDSNGKIWLTDEGSNLLSEHENKPK